MSDRPVLETLQKVVSKLQTTTKITEKKDILQRYPECKEILAYVYNTQLMFHVTSQSITKYQEQINETYDDCDFDWKTLLDNLHSRRWSGHTGIRKVLGYIQKYGHKDLVLGLVDKDLKIRMGKTQINDVFPQLIPEFNVVLAEPMEKQMAYFEKGGSWYLSRKLDGVRCLCFLNVDKKTVTFYSREGNQFLTLGKVEEEIAHKILPMVKENMVLDGEICLIENGLESFSGIMKAIKKADYTIPNPEYIVFDCVSLTEFENGSSTRILSERSRRTNEFCKGLRTVKVLEQQVYTPETLSIMTDQVSEKQWEGLMVRKDVAYEGKRTKNLLKIKKFHREEYIVQSIDIGKISNNGGAHSNELGMKNLVILHKNCKVEVGSGFSDKERLHYYQHPEDIVHKLISVQYFEETVTTKKGVVNYSLRFPTFKGVYGENRDF